MKIFRKNQLVITALAALIAVAGYLNHIEKSEQKGTLAGAKITKETESTVQPETQLETQEAQQAAGTDIGRTGRGGAGKCGRNRGFYRGSEAGKGRSPGKYKGDTDADSK